MKKWFREKRRKFLFWYTNKLLDVVEKLPKRDDESIVGLLQLTRKNQRKLARSYQERAKSKDGSEIDYLGFRLFEVYEFEDFETVKGGLSRLFPNIAGEYHQDEFAPYFDKLSISLLSGGWKNIGHIVPEGGHAYGDRVINKSTEIPNQIRFINVRLHKNHPSMLTLTFDVYLKEEASEELMDIQQSEHLPKAEYTSLLPKKHGFFEGTWGMAEHEAYKAIEGFVQTIKIAVEEYISKFVPGAFLGSQIEKSLPILPCIDMYGIKKAPKGRQKKVTWVKNNRGWWDSFGFNFVHDAYINEHVLYTNLTSLGRRAIPERIVVFWDKYLKAIDPKPYGDNPRNAIWHHMRSYADLYMNYFVLRKHFLFQVQEVEKLRKIAFENLNYRRRARLEEKLEHQATISEKRSRIQRIILELSEIDDYFFRENRDLSNFLEIDFYIKRKTKANLVDRLEGQVDFLSKSIGNYLDYLNNSFSNYVGLLNMQTTHRLERLTILLSLLALIIATIALEFDWQALINSARNLISGLWK